MSLLWLLLPFAAIAALVWWFYVFAMRGFEIDRLQRLLDHRQEVISRDRADHAAVAERCKQWGERLDQAEREVAYWKAIAERSFLPAPPKE